MNAPSDQQLLREYAETRSESAFAALNRTLNEDQNTLAVFDQLPAEDPRRQTLASAA